MRWTHYLVSAGGLVGMHIENSDETVATRYFHKDHLGSIAVITSETAVVLERLSFDASKRSLAPPRRASGAMPTAPMIRPAPSPANPTAASPATSSSTPSAWCT
jgi:hypothetical protein